MQITNPELLDQVVGGHSLLVDQMINQAEINEWERLTGLIHPSKYETGI